MQIITTYPDWFIILCAALSGLYVFILYGFGKNKNELRKIWLYLLGFSRFIVVFLIAFFLLSPLIKTIKEEKERPIVVLAQDVSSSIVQGKDSAFIKGEFAEQVETLKNDLGDDYDIQSFSFGDKVTIDDDKSYSDKQTDISQLFKELDDKFYNTNLAATVLFSDGLYNKGSHPLYYPFSEKYPIYTVGLGDTTLRSDLYFYDTRINEIAFLGNLFPIEIGLAAKKLLGETTVVELWKGSKKLNGQQVSVTSSSFDKNLTFNVKATKPGIQKYTIKIKPNNKEVNLENNTRDLYINVLDNRQKILILADAPHPDVAAIRGAIEKKENYEVTAGFSKDFSGGVEEYSLIILHNVSRINNRLAIQLKNSKVPFWGIASKGKPIQLFEHLFSGISFTLHNRRGENFLPVHNTTFGWFEISDELKQQMGSWPPLHGVLGEMRLSESWSPLLNKQIGNIQTDRPLFSFRKGDRKLAITFAEGLWRWRLTNYVQNSTSDQFDELIGKTVQLLSVKDDKRRFKIKTENQIAENQKLIFHAELYNESYELINDKEIALVLTNEKGEQFDFNFQASGSTYYLEAGIFPPGKYTYNSSVSLEGNRITERGEITIMPISIEKSVITADHQLLYKLSEKTGGEFVAVNQLSTIKEHLKNRKDIQTVIYQHKILDDLINNKWIFFLIIVLLSLEWFVRKRNGLY